MHNVSRHRRPVIHDEVLAGVDEALIRLVFLKRDFLRGDDFHLSLLCCFSDMSGRMVINLLFVLAALP